VKLNITVDGKMYEVEVEVAVRQDVEPGELLVRDDGRDRVEVLLAELDVAERGRVRALEQVPRVPGRPWPGSGHGH
jgi:multidrug resistance efflux pump